MRFRYILRIKWNLKYESGDTDSRKLNTEKVKSYKCFFHIQKKRTKPMKLKIKKKKHITYVYRNQRQKKKQIWQEQPQFN